MIDAAAILFTTLACLFVVVRAIALDARLPWFGEPDLGSPPHRGRNVP